MEFVLINLIDVLPFYISQLNELSKLKTLTDLTHLTVSENPLSELTHYRPYLVFHLRTLEILDSQGVSEDDRKHAKDRFSQGMTSHHLSCVETATHTQ